MKYSAEEYMNLWKKNLPMLRRLCENKLDRHPDEIDDVLSDVFLVYWMRFENDNPPTHINAWLYAVTRNVINQKFREYYKSSENVISLSGEDYQIAYKERFDIIFENEELAEILMTEINEKLTEDEIQFLDLIYNKEIKLKDIASERGMSYNAVKQKHYRIMLKLRAVADKIVG